MNTIDGQTAAPRRANLEPVSLACGLFEPAKDDQDFWQYADRCAALVERMMPEAVAMCEWAGATVAKYLRGSSPIELRDLDPKWRDGWPEFRVTQGCESPILRLEVCTGMVHNARRFGVWSAKNFDGPSTLDLVTFFTCATSQIRFPDSRGRICRTCKGAGRHWSNEAKDVIPCAPCGGQGVNPISPA